MPISTMLSSSASTSAPSSSATAAQQAFYVTTSWDDGSPLDWRVADLLAKYELPGTFYIPRISQRPTMDEAQLRELAESFDIGGHTIDHLPLTTLSREASRDQIESSKSWIEDVTGRECSAFCPPLGRFRRDHLLQIKNAGYESVRTVELLSLDHPRAMEGLSLMPTSVQAYPHRMRAYVKNAVRRCAPANLLRCALHVRATDWPRLCQSLQNVASRHGGVFHIWGHSWEIDEAGQWSQLEEALRILSSQTPRAYRVSNTQLAVQCRAARPGY